ncbi:cysteine--tRNA ligase [Roseinatronobacter alkalisoli]|uniref:Cysteine--tRNA ligase n=1 Tax=Roseinatronobacter alkalisoli TaxID=3028235 RepID=A0ABT5T8J8_9RHOB|nr:cysteine--tRNA ligase [Roseinatronobacter sp. HJB301]MDD7971284.1 cysteine--tRNA ligase [Roseinatronobacter sp. HJB301]
MTKIRLHNSRTRKREDFTPLDPENVRMYVCGPTVYDRAHLGNARPVVVFDVLYRLLRHVYGADHVTYVRNFTDVDDKINARAASMQADGDTRPLNAIVQALTDETIAWYHADMDALGALRPTHEPRATQFITQMIAMIEGLIAKGHAYEVSGHVLFDVRSYPDYGRLSGRSVDDMIAGARVEVAPYKRDPMDFVLWKPSDAALPGWDSPWGRGRPGWHIECSAMSHELLGASFDIHGGGIDLQFPHHENEIAQSCCAFPDAGFARYWLHNEMVQVEGKKMSKSLGNFFTVRDLLDQGIPGEVIRYVVLMTHYRSPMDWTAAKAEEAAQTLFKWRKLTEGVVPANVAQESVLDEIAGDLNTPGALAALHKLETQPRALLFNARLLGLLNDGQGAWYSRRKLFYAANDTLKILLQKRRIAKEEKNFARADWIRDALKKRGISITDMPDGKVKPQTSFDFADAYFDKIEQSERKEVFGDLYKSDGSIDASALVDRYISLVASELLDELERIE